MNDRVMIELGTQIISPLVVGVSSAAISTASSDGGPALAWKWFGIGMIGGLVYSHAVLHKMRNPGGGGGRLVRAFEKRVEAARAPTYIWKDKDEFYHRIDDDKIPEEYWKAVAADVVAYKHPNLTQDIVIDVLKQYEVSRDEARMLHKRMVGILKEHKVVKKFPTNRSEIIYPDGLVFFARVNAGHTSVWQKLSPHSPRGADASQSAEFTQRARGARAI